MGAPLPIPSPRRLELTTGTSLADPAARNAISVAGPTVIKPIASAPGIEDPWTFIEFLEVSYQSDNYDLAPELLLKSWRGRCYLPTAGNWFITCVASDQVTVPFAQVPVRSEYEARVLMDPKWNQKTNSTGKLQVIGGTANTRVLTLGDVVEATAIIVSVDTTSATSIFAWGKGANAGPAANPGTVLNFNQTVIFEGRHLPLAELTVRPFGISIFTAEVYL